LDDATENEVDLDAAREGRGAAQTKAEKVLPGDFHRLDFPQRKFPNGCVQRRRHFGQLIEIGDIRFAGIAMD
jgi:hypothetical protein